MKFGAVTILTGMLIPAIAWGAVKILDLSERTAKNEVRFEFIQDSLSEIRSEQTTIRKLLTGE